MRRKICTNLKVNKQKTNYNKNKMTLITTTTTTRRGEVEAAKTQNWHIQQWSSGHSRATMTMMMSMLIFYCTMGIVATEHRPELPSISQISPKSYSQANDIDLDTILSASSPLTLESTIDNDYKIEGNAEQTHSHEDNETMQRKRVERSALPILNENFPKTGPNDLNGASDGNLKEAAAAGRYFQYNIKPTGTFDNLSDKPELTQRGRSGKTLNSDLASTAEFTSSPFLLKGDPRPITSGSPIAPTSSIATAMAVATSATTLTPHKARQNANPDIQDIITGIVKLLNGNVNVHANTQGLRRPQASRINNRGPPRINDVPPLPIDYETKRPHIGSSIRPSHYPFDRPERPFITGVPIPEQIVPYRPSFVSNRPPWHRNKPRPPITTSMGGRRPIHQYQPQHPMSENEPAQNQLPPSVTASQNTHVEHEPEKDAPDAPNPTDSSYDSDFSNEDANAQYIEVGEQDADKISNMDELEDELQAPPSAPAPSNHKTDEQTQKKNKHKHKNGSEKKKPTTHTYTTIIETSSEVHTVLNMASTYMPMPMENADNIDVEPSAEEVIFMTPSRTPSLETTSTKSTEATTSLPISTISSAGITTTPITELDLNKSEILINADLNDKSQTIIPTPITNAPTSISSTTTTIITTQTTKAPTTAQTELNSSQANLTPPQDYHPRPGIVLDDPEFKPGGRPRPQRPAAPPTQIQPTRQHLPPGYGEIFDVTLSAIQGPGTLGGSQQTINIKPYGSFGSGGSGGGSNGQQADIIVSASGDEGFVSIDGKRTYINLFGDPTDAPAGVTTPASAIPQLPGGTQSKNNLPSVGAGYGVSETEVVELRPTKAQSPRPIGQAPHQQQPTTNTGPTRPHYRQRPTQPPVRIDTCIVGDDSTCDQAQHEHCKTESGVSSCHCRPGYSRRKHREPCRKVISFHLGMRVDRIYEHRIVWDNKLMDHNSEPYGQLSYESIRAIDSAMSMTPYSDEFMDAKVNNIYRGDPNLGGSGVFVNLTIKLDESVETLRPNLRSDVQKHLLGVLHRRNNNIGNSVLYVSSPEGAVSALHDLDECQSRELNDCHASATCTNSWGSFRCACESGFRDPWADQPQRAGRECQSCSDAYCNNHGTCSFNDEGNQVCNCDSSHYGGQCEIDGEVLGVAIGASVAAVIIIVLTLICLIMWSRRWQREQKNAMGSPVFGYMNTAPLKSATLAQPGYQVTLEDRMRWAQIADVMAQTNHYGAEPIGPTRPSSALFAAYPNLQAAALGMGTLGGMSMQSTLQMHQGGGGLAPPVPLPRRLGLSTRSNGMRTLENSSSSEEEDRTDLLGRNFQVPRPKSRSNGSIANQSGIYYDVDYEPSGNGIGSSSVDHLYGSQNQSSAHSHTHSHAHSGPPGIQMSTYTPARGPASYFMK